MKENEHGMTLIVKTASRLTVSLIFIYGLYVALQGHSGPGGGFAGGLIIALSFIQLMLAFGRGRVMGKVSKAKDLFLISLGGLIFLAVASSGLASRRFSGSVILCDVAIAMSVGSGLFIVFSALAALARGGEEE